MLNAIYVLLARTPRLQVLCIRDKSFCSPAVQSVEIGMGTCV